MPCSCLDDFDVKLAERNTRLVRTIVLTGFRTTATPAVEKIAPRGARPVSVIPTYCPFCGTSYDPQPAVPALPEDRA